SVTRSSSPRRWAYLPCWAEEGGLQHEVKQAEQVHWVRAGGRRNQRLRAAVGRLRRRRGDAFRNDGHEWGRQDLAGRARRGGVAHVRQDGRQQGRQGDRRGDDRGPSEGDGEEGREG